MRKIFYTALPVLLIISIVPLTDHLLPKKTINKTRSQVAAFSEVSWKAPDTTEIAATAAGNRIRYGRELILHTARYFGPHGKIARISNGMNCNNCHTEAGTRLMANNFSGVASGYPVFRNRSGKIETIEKRINDCFERSLNGQALQDSSNAMKAMIAYMNWIGKDVDKKMPGAGTEKLPFLNRAADTSKGKIVYMSICKTCHGENGEGKWDPRTKEYVYPPLWGKHSYNVGAGMYRLSKFAGFVKNNMPFGTTYKKPLLTNEQAWDVAAFVNSKPRPLFKNLKEDWPILKTKPPDYPFGPYADKFSEAQHKYGPFQPITAQREKEKRMTAKKL